MEHVRFQGLSFQHAAWHLPPNGFSTPQAACKLGAARSFTPRAIAPSPGAEVACVGRYAIWFDLDSSYNGSAGACLQTWAPAACASATRAPRRIRADRPPQRGRQQLHPQRRAHPPGRHRHLHGYGLAINLLA